MHQRQDDLRTPAAIQRRAASTHLYEWQGAHGLRQRLCPFMSVPERGARMRAVARSL